MNFNRFQKNGNLQSMFSDHKGSKFEIRLEFSQAQESDPVQHPWTLWGEYSRPPLQLSAKH